MGFGLGSVDATMNMQGIGVQALLRPQRDGLVPRLVESGHDPRGAWPPRSPPRRRCRCWRSSGMVAVVLIPVELVASTRFVHNKAADEAVPDPLAASAAVPWRPLLVFGAAVVGAFIIDSSVSNWSALDLTDVLGRHRVGRRAGLRRLRAVHAGRAGSSPTDWWAAAVRSRVITAGGLVAAVGLLGRRAARPPPVVAIAGVRRGRPRDQPDPPAGLRRRVPPRPGNTGIAVARVNVGNYIGFVIGAPLVGPDRGVLQPAGGIRRARCRCAGHRVHRSLVRLTSLGIPASHRSIVGGHRQRTGANVAACPPARPRCHPAGPPVRSQPRRCSFWLPNRRRRPPPAGRSSTTRSWRHRSARRRPSRSRRPSGRSVR